MAFCVLVLIRFVLGYWLNPGDPLVGERTQAIPRSLDFLASSYRKDYSNNLQSIDFAAGAPLPADQLGNLEVYTREARVGVTSSRFDQHVKDTLSVVDSHGADIRLEEAEGVTPHRSFRVIIRVPVDRFASCVDDLKEIGELQSCSVTKEDKSEEVRQRFAERDSLKAYAESLGKLRESEGKVAELLQLEAKIQEIEKQIQALNVSLGEFVKDESFNNVNYSLLEQVPFDVDVKTYPLFVRWISAIQWTIKWYVGGLLLMGLAWLILLSVRTLKEG
ncbi:DUF4349 domain-containing protein [Botrimarina colliarenosi]|uniref:DUF4349 domain-containing protein n=1 Tax=Botrimarina colliarenosi TaxID=2528001 RepID=UPI0018D346BD|nr:DUF4349 domain-containing protein [Botrimarina colliarenosi]